MMSDGLVGCYRGVVTPMRRLCWSEASAGKGPAILCFPFYSYHFRVWL
jgi:hypothetical protein